MIFPAQDSIFWLILSVLMGACVGSFLNVVIYRVPLGLSISKPKRSFCPSCDKQLTWWQNIPIFSWIFLKGRCAFCQSPISSRYLAVELLTAVLFGFTSWIAPLSVLPIICAFLALLVVITFIDAEHMIIPLWFTWGGSALGLIACCIWPNVSDLSNFQIDWKEGLFDGVIGWIVGFGSLFLVVELGKRAFGKLEYKFDEAVDWCLEESKSDTEPMRFLIDEHQIEWWDIFSRKSDRLHLTVTELEVDGRQVAACNLKLAEDRLILENGDELKIEDLISVSGKTTHAVVPREAMGMGDPHLLAMAGALLGWSGAIFSMFAATLLALLAAIFARVGFGKPLPFGPFIAAGAIAWMFGGWQLWQWYTAFLGF